MIDTFFILFTGGMAVYVILRAAFLDRKEPRYELALREAESSAGSVPKAAPIRRPQRASGRARSFRTRSQ